MRKRSGGGGGGSGGFQPILRRRLQSFQNAHTTVDEIVDHLQSNYPDYYRLKRQTLTTAVKQALHSSPKNTAQKPSSGFKFHGGDGDDDDEHPHAIAPSSSSPCPSRKKLRRIDASEERLRHMEVSHIQRRHHSDSPSSSEEEEDGSVSTSEDAPKFDLMKSMLRQGYTQSRSSKSKLEENNIEMEVGTNKTKNKIDMINEGGSVNNAELNKETKAASGNVEVNGKEGPRFKDLGGMGGVLEELKMEVIVPLYHPHLPRWLGVRPMAGILLHGPPGCGKTKLAHAIANETGVPFYKISATEVVSGVSGIYLLCSSF